MTEAEIHDMTEQIDQRLGTVEVRQARLEASLENVIHEIGKMAAAVDRVDGHLLKSKETNWGNLISASALVVAGGAAFGGLFIRPIQIQSEYNRAAIQTNKSDLLVEASRIEKRTDMIAAKQDDVRERLPLMATRAETKEAESRLNDISERVARLEEEHQP